MNQRQREILRAIYNAYTGPAPTDMDGAVRAMLSLYNGQTRFAPVRDTDKSVKEFAPVVEDLLQLESEGLIRLQLFKHTNLDQNYHARAFAQITDEGERVIDEEHQAEASATNESTQGDS